jgi:hypothetical protein
MVHLSGIHYIDYEAIDHQKKTVLYSSTPTRCIISANADNEPYSYFNDFFINQFNQELAQRFSLSIFNEQNPILPRKI